MKENLFKYPLNLVIVCIGIAINLSHRLTAHESKTYELREILNFVFCSHVKILGSFQMLRLHKHVAKDSTNRISFSHPLLSYVQMNNK